MSISAVSGFLGSLSSLSGSTSAGQKAPVAVASSDLDQIREKGLSAWAHDQQMEKLKQQLRDKILSDKKMSEGDVAAMPAEQRATIEDEIARLIMQRLQEAMETKVKDAAEQGKTQAVLLNISV